MYACDDSTGVTEWHYTTVGGIFTAPAIVGNTECMGSLDNKTYALNAQRDALQYGVTRQAATSILLPQ